jgi:Kef-type K+ transport system membrane component KefB
VPSLLVLLLIELGMLLVAAALFGQIAQRLLLPAIVGELLAGVVLGPTILGRIPGGVSQTLFPPDAALAAVRTNFLTVGLLLFILLVGLEIDPGMVRQRLRVILPTSLIGMAVPFVAGFAAALLFPSLWSSRPDQHPFAIPFIVGVALSISALPVIARTLTDLGLIRTEIGRIILSSAVIDDVFGWLGFAAVIASFASIGSESRPVWETLVFVLGAFALTLTAGRRAGARLARWLEANAHLGSLGFGLILALTLVAAGLMELVGFHLAFFGALMVGIALSAVGEHVFDPLAQVVRSFFTPLYFGAVALSVDFVASFDLALVVTVFVIACVGKLIGAGIGALIGGSSVRDASAIASGMNARGAVEILLASLARQADIIDDRLFVALVIMAVATSITAGSLIQRILQVQPPARLVRALTPVLQRLDPYGHPVEEIDVGQRLTIGRHPSNQLSLGADSRVSLEHALIRRVNGDFRIEDLNSTNGTLLWHNTRWREVTLDTLRDGDIFVVGSSVFRFSAGVGASQDKEDP